MTHSGVCKFLSSPSQSWYALSDQWGGRSTAQHETRGKRGVSGDFCSRWNGGFRPYNPRTYAPHYNPRQHSHPYPRFTPFGGKGNLRQWTGQKFDRKFGFLPHFRPGSVENCKIRNIPKTHCNFERGEWKCLRCLSVNFNARISCFKCCLSKYSAGRKIPTNWNCFKCSFWNFSFRRNCLKCRCSRSNSESLQQREYGSPWPCNFCKVENWGKNSRCFKCRRLKQLAVDHIPKFTPKFAPEITPKFTPGVHGQSSLVARKEMDESGRNDLRKVEQENTPATELSDESHPSPGEIDADRDESIEMGDSTNSSIETQLEELPQQSSNEIKLEEEILVLVNRDEIATSETEIIQGDISDNFEPEIPDGDSMMEAVETASIASMDDFNRAELTETSSDNGYSDGSSFPGWQSEIESDGSLCTESDEEIWKEIEEECEKIRSASVQTSENYDVALSVSELSLEMSEREQTPSNSDSTPKSVPKQYCQINSPTSNALNLSLNIPKVTLTEIPTLPPKLNSNTPMIKQTPEVAPIKNPVLPPKLNLNNPPPQSKLNSYQFMVREWEEICEEEFLGFLNGVVVENRAVYDDSYTEVCKLKVKNWEARIDPYYYIEPCNWQGKGRPKFTAGNILTITEVGEDDANFPDILKMIMIECKNMVKCRLAMKFGFETDKKFEFHGCMRKFELKSLRFKALAHT